MQQIRYNLRYNNYFCMDAAGNSGGLVVLWNDSIKLEVVRYHHHFIDIEIIHPNYGRRHFTGFYGISD